MGKTNHQTANQRLVFLCTFPEPHDSSQRGSRALTTRLRNRGVATLQRVENDIERITPLALLRTLARVLKH